MDGRTVGWFVFFVAVPNFQTVSSGEKRAKNRNWKPSGAAERRRQRGGAADSLSRGGSGGGGGGGFKFINARQFPRWLQLARRPPRGPFGPFGPPARPSSERQKRFTTTAPLARQRKKECGFHFQVESQDFFQRLTDDGRTAEGPLRNLEKWEEDLDGSWEMRPTIHLDLGLGSDDTDAMTEAAKLTPPKMRSVTQLQNGDASNE